MFDINQLDRVRKSSNGWYTAHCPSCGNKRMGVRQGDKAWVFNCWEGCRVEDICGTLGISVSDLFYDDLEPVKRLSFDPDVEQYILAQAVTAKKKGSPLRGDDRVRAMKAKYRLQSIDKYQETMRRIG